MAISDKALGSSDGLACGCLVSEDFTPTEGEGLAGNGSENAQLCASTGALDGGWLRW